MAGRMPGMKPYTVEYLVCPRCGHPMMLVGGKWVCRVCGYTLIQRRRTHSGLVTARAVA